MGHSLTRETQIMHHKAIERNRKKPTSPNNNTLRNIIPKTIKKLTETHSMVIKHTLLIHGFVREMEMYLKSHYAIHNNRINIIIPIELTRMIISFFPSYQIYGIGFNTKGQLGLNHNNSLNEYQELLPFSAVCSDAKYISVGNKRFMVQDANNKVYCSGFNHYGQLGIGKICQQQNTFSPMIATSDNMISLQEVDFISSGIASNHTFIKSLIDNKIYGFGANMYSQLGFKNQSTDNEMFPVHISDKLFMHKNIINIECGLCHTIFLSSDGNVFGVGSNEYGQCGLGRQVYIKTPVLIDFSTSPNYCSISRNIISINCGSNFTVFMNDHSELMVCGNNEYGQLGTGASTSIHGQANRFNSIQLIQSFNNNVDDVTAFKDIKIVKISCGYGYTACIDEHGKCYVWGCNLSSQLGKSKQIVNMVSLLDIEHLIDVSCGSEHTLFLSRSNKVYICGQNNGMCWESHGQNIFKTPTIIPKCEIGVNEDMPVTKVIAGTESSLIILQWTSNV